MFGQSVGQIGQIGQTMSYPNAGGTTYLRNTVRTSLYSGDSVIETKLLQYQLFWKFYENRHWADHNDTLISFNYCRALIDKVAKFMIGKEGFGFDIEDLY